MKLVEMQLELATEKRSERASPVEAISVAAVSCVMLVERQRLLFDEPPRLDRASLAHLINRLAVRLGAEQVVRAVLQAGAQPEYAFHYQSLVGRSVPMDRRVKPSRSVPLMSRPVQLFRPAIPIGVLAMDDGSPRCVTYGTVSSFPGAAGKNAVKSESHRFVLSRVWGPERIETGWWRDGLIRRQYWRVETDDGRWLWIYRDLEPRKPAGSDALSSRCSDRLLGGGEWFLHGVF
jgi:protein ImuB